MAILPGMGPRGSVPRSMAKPATRAADRVVRFRMRGMMKYTFMPEFGPRVRRLGRTFGHFAYMLAQIFGSVRLLPPNHPMLNPRNIGDFGIMEVVSAAANNLVMDRKNLDQILIFGAIIAAVIMIFIQIIIIGLYVAMAPTTANAADGMFTTPNPDDDVVLTFLQQTIGLDKFFNNRSPIGFSIAAGLRAMLGFYSTGLMLIATLIVVYYVLVVVGESAQTGQPFGKRFNGLWAPIRLVVALGLLVPLGNGLNAAQYTALTIARAGSGFATQAWNKFTKETIDTKNLMTQTIPSGFTNVARKIFLHEVCASAYNRAIGADNPRSSIPVSDTVQMKLFTSEGFRDGSYESPWSCAAQVGAFAALGGVTGGAYTAAAAGFGLVSGASVTGDFGFCRTTKTLVSQGLIVDWSLDERIGNKNPIFSCGSIVMSGNLPRNAQPPSIALQKKVMRAYIDAIVMASEDLIPHAVKYAQAIVPSGGGSTAYSSTSGGPLPTPKVLTDVITKADDMIYKEIVEDGKDVRESMLTQALGGDDWKKGGWGNAATFYMKVAFANQSVSELIRRSGPRLDRTGPAPSASLGESQSNADGAWYNPVAWWDYFRGNQSDKSKHAEYLAKAMKYAETQVVNWIPETNQSTALAVQMMNMVPSNTVGDADNITRAIYEFFGINALSALADPTQQNVFPMVKLSQIGADLIGKVPETFAAGFIVSMALTAVGNMIFFIGLLGLGIGFLLYYVLPFMPFIYFFFAIVEWVMGVLEAMLGAPLWALAHLRIEGDGLPSQAAMQGYNILLGILLRPFFILFGLLSSYICFNSAANFLNQIFWGIVAVRNGGPNGSLDLFGWTFDIGPLGLIGYLIVYAIIVYNLGLVCFKMIDQIPNQALRWMGISDATYKDGKTDPIGNVSGAAMTAGTMMAGQVASNTSNIGSMIGAPVRGGVKAVASKGASAAKTKSTKGSKIS